MNLELLAFLQSLDSASAEDIETQLEIAGAFIRGFRLARDRFEDAGSD